jgi:hypothetical protein
MRRRITSRLLAWGVSQLIMVTGPTLANTVGIVHGGFGAYDVATVCDADQYGTDVTAGVYTLNKTGDSGFSGLDVDAATANQWLQGLTRMRPPGGLARVRDLRRPGLPGGRRGAGDGGPAGFGRPVQRRVAPPPPAGKGTPPRAAPYTLLT